MSVVSEVVSGDQSAYLLVNAGAVMYTPWKGGWFDSFSADFDLGSTHVATDLIFRYKDARNYFRVRYLTSTIYLQEVVRGKVNTLQSAAAGSTSALGFNLKVTVHFDRIGVYFNSSLKFTYTRSSDPFRRFFGHCGVWARTASGTSYKIRNLSFSDLEADVSSSRLLHMALGYAGYLLAIISPDLSDAMQLDTMWGPQTDNEDPLTALKKIIETNELQVLAKWPFDASPTIHVDQFTGFETGTTIDDEIISYENVETSLIRPNIVMVDGNEHSWTEYYRPDLLVRDMAVVQYLDLPSLKTQGDVTNRANEELGKGLRSVSPGGTVIWRPTYQRLDNVLWVDQFGETWSMRIEGLEIDFDQGMSPFQRVKIDGGPLSICDDTTEPGTPPAPIVYLASDTFNSRSVTSGWGTAELGGAWTVSGTATQWNVSALAGLLSPTPSSTMLVARLASISGPSLTLQTDIWREKTTVQGNQNFGLMARWIDASNYLLIMVVSKPASTSLIVQQVLAGVRSTVATYALGWGIMQILDTATIQAQVSGNSPVLINCKAWKSRTDPEPSEFQLITNVPGSWATTGPVGLAGNLDPSTINAPVIMHFDNFKVW
jgi:hypothetical protein